MSYKAVATVRFKKSVLEPQGQAILLSLKEHNQNIELIRVGRYIEVMLNAANKKEAEQQMQQLADDLLYNPVMEVCEIHVEESGENL